MYSKKIFEADRRGVFKRRSSTASATNATVYQDNLHRQQLLKQDRASDTPGTQLWTEESFNEEEIVHRQYCPNCNERNIFRNKQQKVLVCSHCSKLLKREEAPILDLEQEIRPFSSQTDEDFEPAFISYNPDSQDTSTNEKYEIVSSRENGRLQKIHIKGAPDKIGFYDFEE